MLRALMAAREDGAGIDPVAVANEIGIDQTREHIDCLTGQMQAAWKWEDCGESWDILPRRPLIACDCVQEALRPGQLVAVSSLELPAKQKQLRAEADRVLCGRILRKWGLEEPCHAEPIGQGEDAHKDELWHALSKLWKRKCGKNATLPREQVQIDRLWTVIDYQLYCHNRELSARKQLAWGNMGLRWALRYRHGTTVDQIAMRPDSNLTIARL